MIERVIDYHGKGKNLVGLSRDYVIHPGETLAEVIMNKRKILVGISVVVICMTVGILSIFIYKQYGINQAIRIYQEFIEGERTANGWNIKTLSTPTGEPKRRVETKEYHPLENGAFLFKIDDRHDYGENYKYLRTAVTGDEEVRNAVEWTRYCTFKH